MVTSAGLSGRQLVLNTAVAAGIVFSLAAFLPHGVFWGPDSGNRFIQLQSFDRHGFSGIAISPVAPHLDPDGRFFPTAGHHFQRFGGEFYSFYSPLFAAMNVPSYRSAGVASLVVLPAVAAILLVALFGYWVDSSTWFGRFLPIILLVATPLLFYGVVFWEHTLSAACALVSIVLLTRSDQPRSSALLLSGIMAGCATLLREETYILMGAMLLALLSERLVRGAVVFAGGAVAVVAPLWLFNTRLYGHPLGLHAVVYSAFTSSGARITEMASNLPVYLFEFGASRMTNVLLAIPAVVLFALAFLHASPIVDRVRAGIAVGAALSAVGSLILLLSKSHRYEDTLYTQGLFLAVPLAMFAFLSPREGCEESKVERRVIITAAVALIGTCLALNQRDFGIIWGPRHFLALIPLLLFLSLRAIERFHARGDRQGRRLLTIAVAVVIAASVGIQAHGISVLHGKLRFSNQIVERIEELKPSAIVTDVFWVPEDLATLFFKMPVLEVRSDEELKALSTRLAQSGARRFVFVASRKFRRISQDQFRTLVPHVRYRVPVRGGEPMLDVMILLIELPPARPQKAP